MKSIVVVASVSALIWHVQNERAAEREWEAYKRAAAARGESVDWQRIVPVPPPVAQNFYESAVAEKWMPRKQDAPIKSASLIKAVNASGGDLADAIPTAESRALAPHLPPGVPPPTMKMLRALPRMDLEKLHDWLEQWNAEFVEFRAAGKRKAVFLEGDYNSAPTMPIQDFVAARTLAQTVAAKAKVNLVLGRPNAAALDLESLASVIRGMESKPQTTMAATIRTAIATVYLDVVQEGLAERAWPAEELQALQAYLDNLDLIGPTATALKEAERIGISQLLDLVATGQADNIGRAMGPDSKSRAKEAFMSLYPKSWVRRNQVFIATVCDEAAQSLDAKARRYDPQRVKDLQRRVSEETKSGKPNRIFAAMLIPNFGKTFEAAARRQTMAMLASAACRLEQLRLKTGAYPEKLADPPRDLVTGTPMIYRKAGDGFVLYATGPDGRDDGGDPKADWVWGKMD